MFQGTVTLLPGTGRSVSVNVNETRKHFSRNIYGARMFPQFLPVCPTGNIVSSVKFCFQDAKYAYATRQGILTKIWAWKQLQKIYGERKQTSTNRGSIFTEIFPCARMFPLFLLVCPTGKIVLSVSLCFHLKFM